MARDLGELNREDFARYKDDVKKEGKPFFPRAIFHDTVMSLIVVSVIVALAAVWYYSADGVKSGILGPWYTEPADPATTSFVPRPDWYFYFLFYLLRIFKWPATVILGTIGIPTIALVFLLALPFADRRYERRLLRRPVALVAAVLVVLSMGVLTYKGATAKEAVGSEALAQVPTWAKEEGFASNAVAVKGAQLFAQTCLTCHTYKGAGTSNYGAPDLSSIGGTGQGVEFFKSYVSDPSKFGNTIMPQFGKQLTKEQITQIATFLDASKGGQ